MSDVLIPLTNLPLPSTNLSIPLAKAMAPNLADIQFRLSRVTPLENNLFAVVLEEFEQHSLSECPAEDGFRLAEAYVHVEKNLLNLSLYETRLGLASGKLIIAGEDPAEFDAVHQELVESFMRRPSDSRRPPWLLAAPDVSPTHCGVAEAWKLQQLWPRPLQTCNLIQPEQHVAAKREFLQRSTSTPR